MSFTPWLWDALHDLFDTDDGSLPDVFIEHFKPDAVIRSYALLRNRATKIVTQHPYFWSISDVAERPLDSVPNAAALVVSGCAEPFHVVFGGIRGGNTAIPDLGIHVFRDMLGFDYRMGSEWGPLQLDGFFALLFELVSFDPECNVALDESLSDEIHRRFKQSWARYRDEQST